jgi:GT2 family glycosyltransferase
MTTRPINCPVCEAEALLHKTLGEHTLYRCASCEGLFYYPFPLEDEKDEAPWQSAKWYVERGANILFYSEVLARIRTIVELLPRKKEGGEIDMLEVGCSYGFLMDMAAVLFGWDVSGVDPRACAREGARELERKIFNVRLEDAQFDRQFDVIAAVQLIEHIHKPFAFADRISDLTAEDGLVILTTPDASVEDLGPEYAPGEHHIIFSRKGLASLLSGAGLSHYHFFGTSMNTIMGVASARVPVPSPFNIDKPSDQSSVFKNMALEYLKRKLRAGSCTGALGIGLSFRLFELLVNEGRYDEADRCARKLEASMELGESEAGGASWRRLWAAMCGAGSAARYVSAGPGCLAPYLFYKGILNLNHRKDSTAAHECFTYAARLFEHEVRDLGLIQYAPLLGAAREHVEIAAGMAVARVCSVPREEVDDIYGESRSVRAVPFIRGGIAEFCSSVQVGRLRWKGLNSGNAFIFTFRSMEDNLSGAAFNLFVRPRINKRSVKVTLYVFEEFNPVALRKTSRVIKFDSPFESVRFTESFGFDPIKDSRGKTCSFVLSIGKDVGKADISLLCSTLKGALTVAGHQQLRDIQPVTLPYYSVTAHFRKQFPDNESALVSCLIVTYNSEGCIRHCLNSIAAQDYPNIETVVIDNHSDDRTVEVIREEFHNVNLFVMEENLQFCKGNNFGLSKCRGKFVCVLNADAVLESGAIRRFVQHIEISPHIAMVGSTIETRGSITRYADTFMLDGLVGSDEKLLAGIRFASAACGAGFMIRRSVISDLGYLFDEGFNANWEDHDLGLRCWLKGYMVVHIPELGAYHYGGSGYGLADPGRESQIFRNRLLTYFKNFGKRLFLRAFLKTLRGCTTPYRFWGIVRFLCSFWKYIPERIALQRGRNIDDSVLQVVTSGILAITPEDENNVSSLPFGEAGQNELSSLHYRRGRAEHQNRDCPGD